MKKSILIICAVAIGVACKPEVKPKDYVSLSGTITNHNASDSLVIRKGRDYMKVISLNEDGSFNDTLKIPEEGKYMFLHNSESGSIYLANGDKTSFTLNTEEFDETLKFKGGNADKSNFGIANYLLNETHMKGATDNGVEGFKESFASYKKTYEELKANSGLDTAFLNKEDRDLMETEERYLEFFQKKADLITEFVGKPSPIFENYENYNGGTSSLSDFKGKYVYVDVWATWCGPCKAEIPHLKTIEEKYHDKNIEFVSISVDKDKDGETTSHEAWKAMIAEKEMGGVQLYSDKDWKSDFVTAYKINGIPRFILIGPDGNVVSPDAPRPSSPKLVELFDVEGI